MALKTTTWDSADYLKSEADITAYLDACFEEAGDDPAFLTHALGVVARAQHEPARARFRLDPGGLIQGAVVGRKSQLRNGAEGCRCYGVSLCAGEQAEENGWQGVEVVADQEAIGQERSGQEKYGPLAWRGVR